MNAKEVVVPMKEGFVHDLKAMAKACTKNTKAIFITNPNNPTGTYNTKKEFEEFLKALPLNKYGVKPLVISDEAYYEYAAYKKDFPDTLKYLAKSLFNLDAKFYKEYEFIYEEENNTYHGIIDLMIEYDDEIIIIDYKLKNIDDENYRKQLNGYKSYIEKLTKKNVSTYLYSIMDSVFLEVK